MLRAFILVLIIFSATVQVSAQKNDSVSIAKENLYDEDTFMMRDSFYKFYVSYDYSYSPLATEYGNMPLTGGGMKKELFSFSGGAGLWYRHGKRMGVDVSVEVGYKQFYTDTLHYKRNTTTPGVQLVKSVYGSERYFICVPFGFTYQWGKRWRFGLNGFLTPKFNVINFTRGYEYFSDGTYRGANYSGLLRPNVEMRFAPVIEIPVGNSKIKIYPQYRWNIFSDSKKDTGSPSKTVALCLEFML